MTDVFLLQRIYPRLLAAETAWRDLEAVIEQGEVSIPRLLSS